MEDSAEIVARASVNRAPSCRDQPKEERCANTDWHVWGSRNGNRIGKSQIGHLSGKSVNVGSRLIFRATNEMILSSNLSIKPLSAKTSDRVVKLALSPLQNLEMPTELERKAFSKRLRDLLDRERMAVKGPSELSVRFNLIHPGSSITPQTAHKWLNARSIPTYDKIDTLAKWFDVSAHWLQYGPAPPKSARQMAIEHAQAGPAAYTVSHDSHLLAAKIESLKPSHRTLVEQIVSQLQVDTVLNNT